MYVVAKPFKTFNRKFSIGEKVSPWDIAGDVTFETWLERKFIVDDAKPVRAAKHKDITETLSDSSL